MNRLQSGLIILGLFAVAAWTGYAVIGPDAISWAVLLAGLLLLGGATSGDKMIRGVYGAVPLDQTNAPELSYLVEQLARGAELPVIPRLYLLPSPVLQAMAVGDQKDPAIALTSGLVRTLPTNELVGVLAHEIAHVRHGDTFVMRLAVTVGSITQAMSSAGLFMLFAALPMLWTTGALISPMAIGLLILSPVLSDLLELSLSRRREFLADAGAVELMGDPRPLAQALARIQTLQGDDWERMRSRGIRWLSLFRTHPTTWERVKRLQDLAPSAEPELTYNGLSPQLQQVLRSADPRRRRIMRRLL
ncbi:heat shock protein HtpX [Consotaella salsifontis]|uniref:Heat shock protein HtpX n=1 Tax=Consotaella salsifontis TaxID=1365950 RepID=A0A1T4SA31_9HYPH|nr:heat shock protein HtpX [Consotaella salsifontis]